MSNKPLRALLRALALVFSATTLAAGPGKGETLRVQDYPGVGNTLMRVAVAKQYCEKYGIQCTVRQLATGPIGLQAFMAGELEVAYAGPEVLYQAVEKGGDLKVVSGGA